MSEQALSVDQLVGAVYDLLKYCRNPGHQVTSGLLLGPALGVEPSSDGRDDARLALALEELISKELAQLRLKMGMTHSTEEGNLTVEAMFRQDQATKNSRLERLSLVWAYYLAGLPTETFTQIYDRVQKTVENKLTSGRREVAKIIAQHQYSAPKSPNGHKSEIEHFQRPTFLRVNILTHKERNREQNRQVFLEKVRTAWITDFLERSIPSGKSLDVDMRKRSDTVKHLLDDIAQRPYQASDTIQAGTEIIDVYEEYGGELAILGAPGAGKTIALLNLARELITRAQHDSDHPIPVVFNLASWSPRYRPLGTWIIEELRTRYAVPRDLGKAWLEDLRILPLLDGLDEVGREHQVACIEAINKFRRTYGFNGLVVCSRTDDYLILGVRLELRGAIELLPLASTQIDAYLRSLNGDTRDLRAALTHDINLHELARTPLLLNLIVSMYQSTKPSSSENMSLLSEPSFLWSQYIEQMINRRSRMHTYSHDQVLRWLAWLANSMEQHDQTTFLIEWMQPSWLREPRQKARYIQQIGLIRGMLVGFACGILVVLVLSLLLVVGNWPLRLNSIPPRIILLGELVGGVVFGVAFGLIGYIAARRTKEEVIQPIEILGWSSATARLATVTGIGSGATCLTVFGWAFGLGTGILYGLAVGLALGLLVLARGMSGSDVQLERKLFPNQGIIRSGQNALGMGLGIGLSSGAAIALMTELTQGSAYRLVFGLPFGLAVGIFMVLFFGGEAWLKHVILQGKLYQRGLAPMRYVPFLEYAADHSLLRKVGGGYMFIHPLLRDHFAARISDEGVFTR